MFIEPISPIVKMNFDAAKQVTEKNNHAALPFSGILKEAIQNLEQTQEVANQDSYDLAMGNVDDLSQLMINSTKQATALEFTVQLSTRVVNAYKEIMQMQV